MDTISKVVRKFSSSFPTICLLVSLITNRKKWSHSHYSSYSTTLVSTTVITLDTLSRKKAWSLWDHPADESGLTGLCEAVRRRSYPEIQRVKITDKSEQNRNYNLQNKVQTLKSLAALYVCNADLNNQTPIPLIIMKDWSINMLSDEI